MNILIVHEVDYIRKVVYDFQMLAEAMSLRGHNVYVIDYESTWNGTKSPKELDVSRVFPNGKVRLLRSDFLRIAGLSRLSVGVSHMGLIGRTIKERKIDAVLLYSVPTNGLQSVYWAKRHNVPIVFRSLDSLNRLVKQPLLRPITKFMEMLVYPYMDKVLALTSWLSRYVVRLGAKANRVSVLPMPVDTSRFCPDASIGDVRRKWGLGCDDKVVLFMGTLFNFSGLDKLVARFGFVIERIPEAKLLVVGDGEQRLLLESVIRKQGLEGSVVITGFQPYDDMPKYINTADVCVNPFEENDATRDIFPGKTVQYLACAKPLVNTRLSGLMSVIKGESQGIVYVQDVDEMSRTLVALLGMPQQRDRIGQNGLAYVRRVHDVSKVASELESHLEELVVTVKSGQ